MGFKFVWSIVCSHLLIIIYPTYHANHQHTHMVIPDNPVDLGLLCLIWSEAVESSRPFLGSARLVLESSLGTAVRPLRFKAFPAFIFLSEAKCVRLL